METVAEVHIPQPEPFMHKDPVNVMDPVANVLIVAGAAAWATKEIVEKVKEEFKDKDVAKDWEKEINQKDTYTVGRSQLLFLPRRYGGLSLGIFAVEESTRLTLLA
jgi:hypothetical protein